MSTILYWFWFGSNVLLKTISKEFRIEKEMFTKEIA